MAYKKGLVARVKRVEAKVAAQRPETKVYTTSIGSSVTSLAAGGIEVFELGDIVEGTGFNERVGNKIRVHKVECSGTGGTRLGVFLLKSKLAVDPTATDFTDGNCPIVVANQLNNVYVELYSHVNRNWGITDSGAIKFSRKWKAGIPVSYEDPTTASCTHNNLYVVMVNKTVSTLPAFLNVRVWYTDA